MDFSTMPHDDRGPSIKAVAIVFLILTWISVAMRCYVRVFMTKLFRIDDWLAVATLIVFTLFCSFVLVGQDYGTGRHWYDLTTPNYQKAMMWWYCGEITYILTTCLLKVTIGVFLMQICVKKLQINIIRTVIIAFSVFTVYFLFLMILQCHPVDAFWNQIPGEIPELPAGATCLPKDLIARSTYAHGAFSAAADWTLGILPIFLVWNLNMNPRTKISVALILALGAVGSTATVARMFYIGDIGTYKDFLYENTNVSIWSTVEPGMGITASSLACLRPLFQAFLSRSRLLGSSSPGRGGMVWNSENGGYVRESNTRGTRGFRLQSHMLRTVHGKQSPMKDLEADQPQERHGSLHRLRQEDGWNVAKDCLTDESSDEIRRFHISNGATVVHAEL